MKKIYSFSALLMMCLMLLSSVTFTSCDQGDDVDTNQYMSGINLNVFGPCPVARGGVLRFIGTGLDQVTAVTIPGCGDITEIEVINANEIRITVPQTAEPGLVTLKTPKGDITTKTDLTFSEPISLDAISPATIKPGATLTINGEYLNLIKEVIFADNVVVSKFVSQSRSKIEVVVPAEAQTGKIIISDGAEIPNWIYSESELNVTLPSVSKVYELKGQKPGNEISLAGKDFDLITEVVMPNGDKLEFEKTKEELVFTLPENASDGEIIVVPASGVEVVVANLVMAIPEEVVATPAKNLRAGDVITLTGKNMELISSINFAGVTDAVAPATQSETEVTVAMPAAAITGDITLNTNSGAAIAVAIETLKPTFTAFASATVPLASNVTVQGTNLDLVVKAVYTGGASVDVTPASATEITFAMPSTGVETGVVTLVMGNGESIETESLTIEAPVCCYIPELPGEDVEIKGGTVFVFTVANGDKLIEVQIDGKTTSHIINGDQLYVTIPQLANANSIIKLISSNGTIEHAIVCIPATEISNSVWSGMMEIDWGNNKVVIPASAFKDVPAGAKMILCYTQEDQTWAQAQINYGDWTGINFTEGDVKFNQTLVPTDVYGWEFSSRETELVLTQEILDNIQAKAAVDGDFAGAGIIIQGSDLIFSEVRLEWEISLETIIWEGPTAPIGWGSEGVIALSDEAKAMLQPGKTLGFNFTCDPSFTWWQIKFISTWWTTLPSVAVTPDGDDIWDFVQTDTKFEFKLTQEDINIILEQGLQLVGNGVIINSVYIL